MIMDVLEKMLADTSPTFDLGEDVVEDKSVLKSQLEIDPTGLESDPRAPVAESPAPPESNITTPSPLDEAEKEELNTPTTTASTESSFPFVKTKQEKDGGKNSSRSTSIFKSVLSFDDKKAVAA